MFWQLWVVAGIFLGFCANVIVKDTGAISWRLQLGSAFIPSFILGCGIWFCPESPRWLMKHGKLDKGFRSMQRLRAHDIIAARDYYYSYVLYHEELKLARGAGYFARLWDCFAVPRIRRSNYGASTVMIAQQMCGINSEYRTLPVVRRLLRRDSHLLLQLDHFHPSRVHTYSSIVCIVGIWCNSSGIDNSDSLPHRYQRPKDLDSGGTWLQSLFGTKLTR